MDLYCFHGAGHQNLVAQSPLLMDPNIFEILLAIGIILH